MKQQVKAGIVIGAGYIAMAMVILYSTRFPEIYGF